MTRAIPAQVAASIQLLDTDGDGVPDVQDNCLLVANPDQRDTNGDGYGNVCDADLNDDGVVNTQDLGIMKSVFYTSDPDADLNGSGFVNFKDLAMLKAAYFGPPGPTGYTRWVNPAGGDWNDPGNWSTGAVPQQINNALIDVDGEIVITHSTGDALIHGLISRNALAISGGTFEVMTTMRVEDVLTLSGNSTLRNTTVLPPLDQSGQNGVIVPVGEYAYIEDVVLGANMTVSGAGVYVSNGLTLAGATVRLVYDDSYGGGYLYLTPSAATELDGTGTVRFDGSNDYSLVGYYGCSAEALTIGPGVVIRSGTAGGSVYSPCGALDVQGTIRSDLAGKTVSISGAPVTNSGLIEGSGGGIIAFSGTLANAAAGTIEVSGGGALKLAGSFHNDGTIEVSGSPVEISAGFAVADLGNFTSDSIVTFTGVLDNTGQTLDLAALPGDWQLGYGATIAGGTIGGSTLVVPQGGYINLDGVTLATDMTIAGGAYVTVNNALTLGGRTVSLVYDDSYGGAYLYLYPSPTAALAGTGTVRFDGGSYDGSSISPYYCGGDAVTIGPDVLIRSGTAGGLIGSSCGPFNMQGMIRSDVAGRTISIYGSPLTNSGLIEASGGGIVAFSGTLANAADGTIQVSGGGALQLAGSFHNDGTIEVSGSPVEISAGFAVADLGNFTSDSIVTFTGVLDNTGQTLDLAALPGDWQLGYGATIAGGTIGGSTLVVPQGGYINLDGVTLAVVMTVAGGAYVYVYDKLTLAGTTVSLVYDNSYGGAYLYLSPSAATELDGIGTVRFDGSNDYSSVSSLYCGADALTVGPGVVIRSGTAGGSVGNSCGPLDVQGTIRSDLAGRTITVSGSPLRNLGSFEVAAQALISVSSDYTQTAAGEITVEMGGLLEDEAGRVEFAGNAQLAGTLNAVLVNGFAPSACDAVRVMNWQARSGSFGTVNAPDLGNGPMVATSFASGLTLTAPPAGAWCPNLALLGGGTATASSESVTPAFGAHNAVDGVNATYSSWCASGSDAAPRIDVTFPADVTVQRVRVSNAWSPSDFLTGRFQIYNASDVLIYNSGVVTLTNGAIDLDIPDQSAARRARFQGVSWSSACLSEFEVIGTRP